MPSDKKLLLGLTTTKGSNWRDKIQEIGQLNLQEVALLPTALTPLERQNFYKLLEATPLAAAPYVHLRDDFSAEEVDYLAGRFKSRIFSVHADQRGYALVDKLPKYNSVIFVENFAAAGANKLFTPQKLAEHQASGICLDLAHLEEARKSSKKHYKRLTALADKYTIGVSHVSGVKSSVLFKIFNKTWVDHSLDSLHDLLYLKQYPPHYFAKTIVMELENSFVEQLEIKQFLETLVK